MKLKGAEYQGNKMGVYKKLGRSQWCLGRPSYSKRNSGDDDYLYYVESESGFEGWVVGPTVCGAVVSTL